MWGSSVARFFYLHHFFLELQTQMPHPLEKISIVLIMRICFGFGGLFPPQMKYIFNTL